MNPLVSIIIPLYNRENLIIETLGSVLSQTYDNWECIVVDDGSTDNSYNVVEQYIKDKSRYKLYKRPSQHKSGGAGARNYGYLKSKGDYILWLDSDDLIENNKLKLQIKDLLQHNADLSISKWKFFPKKLASKKCPEEIFKTVETDFKAIIKGMGEERTFFALHSYLVKRDIIIKSGLWLEDLHLNDDGEFFIRVLINSKSIILNKNTYALYRVHPGERISLETSLPKLKENILSWRIIDAHLSLIDEDLFNNFLNYKKTILFNQLIETNNEALINENKCFFSKQLKIHKAYNSNFNKFKIWVYNKLYN